MPTDQTYSDFQSAWTANSATQLRAYAQQQTSFVHGLLPEQAVQLSGQKILETLAQRLGVNALTTALNVGATFPSPIADKTEPGWIKSVNMVGINVRTIQSFWNVVKYALTLPASQSSIHLLPMWEPGVVSSLYGMASWNINPEFYSQELYHLVPQLNTVEKQLKVVINLLHAMGKTVGMDVIPHADRYAEMVLAQPHYFEWLQRKDDKILDHSANLHEKVQGAIMSWLIRNGSADFGKPYPQEIAEFYGEEYGEEARLRTLFGQPDQYQQRQNRRAGLVDWLYRLGYEPVPATMAPPYRGLEVDPDPAARVVDHAGREWRDYRITQPEKMSRVFGPLSRFKFYERLDNNRDWGIDFTQPRKSVWEYFCQQYARIQAAYNLDFMRGDMSHVQMRPEGVPTTPDAFYDPLGAVKEYIRKQVPYFGYFAESFLAPPNVMAYGDEIAHLEASKADTTLGDLQSMVVGSPEFMDNFHRYLSIAQEHEVAPNFTIMTGDKDDPRFDLFYRHGNAARLFIGLFLPVLPSYQGLGFEQRDIHHEPAPNEHYTKLYVFHLDEGPKATSGPYQWGKNGELFGQLSRIRELSEQIYTTIEGTSTQWLNAPDPNGNDLLIAWTQQDNPTYLFVVNLAEEQVIKPRAVTIPEGTKQALGIFSSETLNFHENALTNTGEIILMNLQAGECRCYELK
ncbi:hypothetical protein [Lewinella cohaerens]|uniref:hypothetical protein n=1 Tax=Lewinella cohaerens TaxID=70995 RepID=UPI00035E931F|nr:hypothetical protein [Lewinella cohaerens]